MPSASDHYRCADDAYSAAEELRCDHPEWAVVPLFYSAMHLMHARFIEDDLPQEMQCPRVHKSQWRDDVRVKWGTTDVVVRNYPKRISTAYSSLYLASRAVRYDLLSLASDERFWADYKVIRGGEA